MNKEEIVKTLKKYNFKPTEYIVLSSGAMVMHDIKDKANDIDIAVSPDLCDFLRKKYQCTKHEYSMDNQKVTYYSFDVIDFGTYYYDQENVILIDGIPVQNVSSLLQFKKKLLKNLNRQKDINDIKLIENHLMLQNLNPLVLAYLGDAVYELYIRKYLIDKGICKVDNLQKEAVKYVSAKAQSDFLEKLNNSGILTLEEQTLIKRARNHKSHKSKSTDIITYKRSTGLEALIGFLYLNNKPRLEEIINYIVGD